MMWLRLLRSACGQVFSTEKMRRGCGAPHVQSDFEQQVKRGVLYDNAYKLKKLRDRIAHHEPIFAENHHQHVGRLKFVLGAVHPDLPDLVMEWFPGLLCTIEGYDKALDTGIVDL